jgi:excisionase family DNA binding protein
VTLLSTTQAAKLLAITAPRVRVLAATGRLPGAQKIGNSWVIPQESLRAVRVRKPGRPRRKIK